MAPFAVNCGYSANGGYACGNTVRSREGFADSAPTDAMGGSTNQSQSQSNISIRSSGTFAAGGSGTTGTVNATSIDVQLMKQGQPVGDVTSYNLPYMATRNSSLITSMYKAKGWGSVSIKGNCPPATPATCATCPADLASTVASQRVMLNQLEADKYAAQLATPVWQSTLAKGFVAGKTGSADSIGPNKALYTCRAAVPVPNAGIHPGKTWDGYGACNVSWGGKEYIIKDGVEYLNYADGK
jgi:hypothetical protein